jgi:hypothetical protein
MICGNTIFKPTSQSGECSTSSWLASARLICTSLITRSCVCVCASIRDCRIGGLNPPQTNVGNSYPPIGGGVLNVSDASAVSSGERSSLDRYIRLMLVLAMLRYCRMATVHYRQSCKWMGQETSTMEWANGANSATVRL